MRPSTIAVLSVFALVAVSTDSLAQSHARIFDVTLASPVESLPAGQWFQPSCGTDGGPPSLRLDGFGDFARCPIEERTGLHEIWFIYDDEWEYIARAYRDPVEIGRFSANVFYGQPIITSLLIDREGIVQGYRVITDPRAPADVRIEAYLLLGIFKPLFGDGVWQCVDHPPADRESPVNGTFVKTDCAAVAGGRYLSIEARYLRKAGQDAFEVPQEGYFESQARLEVINAAAVMDAPCCRALSSR